MNYEKVNEASAILDTVSRELHDSVRYVRNGFGVQAELVSAINVARLNVARAKELLRTAEDE